MAVKDVKKYFDDIQEMYLELVSDLHEMEEDFKKDECTEEELNKLLAPVKNIKDNYERLSYIMYLLYKPTKKKKRIKYESSNKELSDYFNLVGLTQEQEIGKSKGSLKVFREDLRKRFKKDE